MNAQFDASFAGDDQVRAEIIIKQHEAVAGWMAMPSALSNAKLHAQNELNRLIQVCNRIAWGTGSAGDGRKPDDAEKSALHARLGDEDREKLLQHTLLAAEQRHLLMQIELAEQRADAQRRAEETEQARLDAEARELAEFEAYDEAGKSARFQAWRAAR
jgi:hypothetical protein